MVEKREKGIHYGLNNRIKLGNLGRKITKNIVKTVSMEYIYIPPCVTGTTHHPGARRGGRQHPLYAERRHLRPGLTGRRYGYYFPDLVSLLFLVFA